MLDKGSRSSWRAGVTNHLVAYATGTAVGALDWKAVDEIVKGRRRAEGYGLRAFGAWGW